MIKSFEFSIDYHTSSVWCVALSWSSCNSVFGTPAPLSAFAGAADGILEKDTEKLCY